MLITKKKNIQIEISEYKTPKHLKGIENLLNKLK